jgi:Protein of unknown function (DUF1778)
VFGKYEIPQVSLQVKELLCRCERETMTEAAEAEVLNRTIVTIPAKDWDAFEAWISRPAKTNPALKKLARVTPSWER